MKKHLIILLGLLIEIGLSRGIALSEKILPQYWGPTTHMKIAEKAIDLLIREGNLKKEQIKELEKYRERIKWGSCNEDLSGPFWRPDNHCYDPRTGRGKEGHASALGWAKGTERDNGNNKDNEYDFYDAIRHYTMGNKSDAYYALGHVCHLLQDLSVPGHTIPAKGSEYPYLPHGRYERYIDSNDDEEEKFLERPTSIITKKSLDDFFNGIAHKSRNYGDKFIRTKDSKDPDVYNIEKIEKETIFDVKSSRYRIVKDVYTEIAGEMVPFAIGYTAGLIKYFLDYIHIQVEKTFPEDKEEDVPVDIKIEVTFDRPIDRKSVLFDDGWVANPTFIIEPRVAGSLRLEDGNKRLILTPKEPLKEKTEYKVIVKGDDPDTEKIEGIRGVNKEILDGDYTFYFRTEAYDTTPPKVISTSPANGEKDVTLDSLIKVTFDEELGYYTKDSIILTTGPQVIGGSITYNIPTMTLTFTPSSPLQEGHPYTVTVKDVRTGKRGRC